jgi:hypothetical protein
VETLKLPIEGLGLTDEDALLLVLGDMLELTLADCEDEVDGETLPDGDKLKL